MKGISYWAVDNLSLEFNDCTIVDIQISDKNAIDKVGIGNEDIVNFKGIWNQLET